MTNVKTNAYNVAVLLASIRTSSEKLNVDVNDIAAPTKCDGIMIKEYYERIIRIGAIFKKYKQLIDKDVADIEIANNKIIQMDSLMQKLY